MLTPADLDYEPSHTRQESQPLYNTVGGFDSGGRPGPGADVKGNCTSRYGRDK